MENNINSSPTTSTTPPATEHEPPATSPSSNVFNNAVNVQPVMNAIAASHEIINTAPRIASDASIHVQDFATIDKVRHHK
jgi:hypothetical protein